MKEKWLEQENDLVFSEVDMESFRGKFRRFLNKIGVKGTVYMLRHTFATNLFYLQVPDKARQSYMGHYSSVLTNDVYTDFDPTIKREDVLNLYINLLPEF